MPICAMDDVTVADEINVLNVKLFWKRACNETISILEDSRDN